MRKDNLIVFCLRCGGHYKENEVNKLKVISGFDGEEMPKNLYICNTCNEALPETDEIKIVEIIK